MYYVKFKLVCPVKWGLDVAFYVLGPFETEAEALAAQKSDKVQKFIKQQSQRSGYETTTEILSGKKNEILFIGGASYYE